MLKSVPQTSQCANSDPHLQSIYKITMLTENSSSLDFLGVLGSRLVSDELETLMD